MQEVDEDDCDVEDERTNSDSEELSIDQSRMFDKHGPGLFGAEHEHNLSRLNLDQCASQPYFDLQEEENGVPRFRISDPSTPTKKINFDNTEEQFSKFLFSHDECTIIEKDEEELCFSMKPSEMSFKLNSAKHSNIVPDT